MYELVTTVLCKLVMEKKSLLLLHLSFEGKMELRTLIESLLISLRPPHQERFFHVHLPTTMSSFRLYRSSIAIILCFCAVITRHRKLWQAIV
ncbi:hypothetical protein AQUCO_00400062v1 [Aquilegia coerulea]|uniref:Uncharacterized protein n=1 Tax=Aquilegia coerulea TaxID=218851 RepID=A0A2G5ET66_AQUCA|nr:hypothetical protein AQUCO_00400062v1 [Aquilegia coerulea]